MDVDELLERLRERFVPKPPPHCPVCGDELQEAKATGKWYCVNPATDFSGYALGSPETEVAFDHYTRSKTLRRHIDPDPDVIALIALVDEYKSAEMNVGPTSQWISVEAEQPMTGELVLCAFLNVRGNYGVQAARRVVSPDEKLYLETPDSRRLNRVTHWQRLPAPPTKRAKQ